MSEEQELVDVKKLREKVFSYTRLMLGEGMVDVELDPEHFDNALTRAIEVFRTRSSAAVEESFAFLATQTDVQIYTLPEEVQTVMKIWRRSIGDVGNAGSQDQGQSLAPGGSPAQAGQVEEERLRGRRRAAGRKAPS